MGLSNEQIKALDALNEERIALHHMRSTPGWKQFFCAEMEKTASFAYHAQATTDNATVMAKQVGAWHVAQSAMAYPDRRLKEIEALIKMLEHQALNTR